LKPFPELATMNPDVPVVVSVTSTSRPFAVSFKATEMVSPELIKSVLELGVKEAEVRSPVPGGPVGTPSV